MSSKLTACLFTMPMLVVMFWGSANAENLNKKYGPSWDCSYISYGADERVLRAECEKCERQRQDFFRTGPRTGYCVSRAGSYSGGSQSSGSGASSASGGETYSDIDARSKAIAGALGAIFGVGAEDSPPSRKQSQESRATIIEMPDDDELDELLEEEDDDEPPDTPPRRPSYSPPPSSDNPFRESRTPSADNPFSRKVAGANPSTDNPFSASEANSCMRQQTANIAEYLKNAKQCLLNTQLIASYDSEPFIDRNSDTEMWGRLANARPRWIINGTRATPVCDLPLKIDSQYDSFSECARVNLCAVRAANCTVKAAQREVGGNCSQLATACLASNPVPQTLAAATPEPQRATSSKPPVPITSATRTRPSGISGPSGRGSGAREPSVSAK